jgi:hypothetical protein
MKRKATILGQVRDIEGGLWDVCDLRDSKYGFEWSKEYRFIALPYAKNILFPDASERAEWTHRVANLVFLTRRADHYARHYFVYSLVMMPLIRLMLDTGRATDRSVVFERFWATLIGSGLVLSTGEDQARRRITERSSRTGERCLGTIQSGRRQRNSGP